MKEMSTGAVCCVDIGGYLATLSRDIRVYIHATLRHFDSKVRPKGNLGPLIPCERRLAKTNFQEFQEVTSRARFENRDYGRPFTYFLVTLRRFD